MDKLLLCSELAKHGDTQTSLSDAMGVSLSRLNAKINNKPGADFTQPEMEFIAVRYGLTAKKIQDIFFNKKVSKLDTRESRPTQ